MNLITKLRAILPPWLLGIVLLNPVLLWGSDDLYLFATPQQQERFQTLTKELRCLVCQNQTLAESDAPLARDLRQLIANLIQNQQSDAQIMAYLTQRYGDFVLFKPPLRLNTYLLWFAPLLLLSVGSLILWRLFKRSPHQD